MNGLIKFEQAGGNITTNWTTLALAGVLIFLVAR